MKTLRTRLLAGLLAIVAFVGITGATYEGYLENRAINGVTVGRYLSGNGCIAMRIKYIGSTVAGTHAIIVDADGDILFEVLEAADTTINSVTDGTIDTAEATENTYGEVCDIINNSTNWQCLLVDVLPSAACDNTLLADTETDADADYISEEGYELYVELTKGDQITACIGPEYTVEEYWNVANSSSQTSANGFLGRSSYASSETGGATGYRNTRAELTWAKMGLTEADGVDANFYLYAVRGNGVGATEILLWGPQLGATDGDNGDLFTFDYPTTAKQPIDVPPGFRLIVMYDSAASAVSAANLQVFGRFWQE